MDVLQKETGSQSVWDQEEGVATSDMIQGLMKRFDEAGLL